MGFMDKAKQRAQEAQRKLEQSGALDKAKAAAQQAQQKLDEVQRSSGSGGQGGTTPGGPVRYDQHGRPIPTEEPAATPSSPADHPPGAPAETTPPPAGPAAAPEPDEPAPAGAAPPAGHGDEAEQESEDAPAREDVNQNPDPFRPIQ